MKTSRYILTLCFISMIAFSCQKEIIEPQNTNSPAIAESGHEYVERPAVPCGSASFTSLNDNLSNSLGNVEILNDADELYIIIEMDFGKVITGYQLMLNTGGGFPTDRNGNILLEEFPYIQNFAPFKNIHTIRIPLNGLPNCFEMVLHANAGTPDIFGNVSGNTEVWMGTKTIINGKGYEYCLGSCATTAAPAAIN